MTSHPLIHIHTELGKKKSVKPVMMILNILKMEVFASFTYLLVKHGFLDYSFVRHFSEY